MAQISMTVNGRLRKANVEPRLLLVGLHPLGLGVHAGCTQRPLAERSRLKDRLRLYRHLQFDVGHSESFGADDLAVSGDQQSETRDELTLHLAFDILTDIAVDRALSDQSGAYKEGTG